jgi:hypothetical protein
VGSGDIITARSGERSYLQTTTCFETFPFPWRLGEEPSDDLRVSAIANASHALVQTRDAWLNPPGADEAELKTRTLTKLYNARPTWLRMAHDMLDDAVLDAYGWAHNLIDTELLELLFVLNRERAAAEVAFVGQLLLPDPAVVTKDRFERLETGHVVPRQPASRAP